MRVPFTDIPVEYTDTPTEKVFDLRQDGLGEIPVLGWVRYSYARPNLPSHHHPGVVEIHFLERGRQLYEVEGQEYDLRGGEMLVAQPGEAHSSGGEPMEPCVVYWLDVRLPKPGGPFLLLPPKEAAELVGTLRNLPSRHFRAGLRINTIFGSLLKLHTQRETALRRTRMRQATVELLLEVIDSSARHAGSDRGGIVREIVRTIESRPADDLRIKDLARLAGYSVSWFKMRFKQETGLSPRQFILRRKIGVACRRLVSSEDPVGQIASDLGFPTSQYFATVFRRLMRVSPRQYREEGAGAGGEREP